MPESISAILSLLEEGREAQTKTNELLGEVRVDVAGMKRTLESQQEGMADLRKQQGDQSERLRGVELTLARLPHTERELGKLSAKHDGLETRVSSLERNGVRTEVVNGAVTTGAKEILKHLASAVAGGIAAALAWTITNGV